MSTTTKFIIEEGKQEVTMQREIPAPPDKVYKAYTDPKMVQDWWGPRRLTNVVDKLEAKRGGSWRIVSTDPKSGHEFAFHGVYHDAETNKRLVRTFEFEGAPGHVLLESTEFEPIDGGKKTLVKARSVFQTVAARDGMVKNGMEHGANESMERLEELLLSK